MFAWNTFKLTFFLNIPYFIACVIPISYIQYYKIICGSHIINIREIVKNHTSVEISIVTPKVFL